MLLIWGISANKNGKENNMERRELIRNATGGLIAGLIGNKMNMAYAGEPSTGTLSGSPRMDGSQVDDWHGELTKRIAAL